MRLRLLADAALLATHHASSPPTVFASAAEYGGGSSWRREASALREQLAAMRFLLDALLASHPHQGPGAPEEASAPAGDTATQDAGVVDAGGMPVDDGIDGVRGNRSSAGTAGAAGADGVDGFMGLEGKVGVDCMQVDVLHVEDCSVPLPGGVQTSLLLPASLAPVVAAPLPTCGGITATLAPEPKMASIVSHSLL